jgi:hypothetical protein
VQPVNQLKLTPNSKMNEDGNTLNYRVCYRCIYYDFQYMNVQKGTRLKA